MACSSKTNLCKIWADRGISRTSKVSLVQTHVFPIALYASETWLIAPGLLLLRCGAGSMASQMCNKSKNTVCRQCFSIEKLCFFSIEKQSLSVDKQCLSNWEAEFFDILCFTIEKHSLSVDKQCLSNRKAEIFDKLCFSIEKHSFSKYYVFRW